MHLNNSDLRTTLEKGIREHVFSSFVEKGFSQVPLLPNERLSELKKAFPLGRLKRFRGNDLDIVEFQFDKFNKPKFVINIGTVPKTGVTLPWGVHIDQNDACATDIPESYRLYNSATVKSWFKLSYFSCKNEKNVKSLMMRVIELSYDIENWFKTKNVCENMRKI